MSRPRTRVEELDTAGVAVRGVIRVVRDLIDRVVQVRPVVGLP
jgi:hypothetical protein